MVFRAASMLWGLRLGWSALLTNKGGAVSGVLGCVMCGLATEVVGCAVQWCGVEWCVLLQFINYLAHSGWPLFCCLLFDKSKSHLISLTSASGVVEVDY